MSEVVPFFRVGVIDIRRVPFAGQQQMESMQMESMQDVKEQVSEPP